MDKFEMDKFEYEFRQYVSAVMVSHDFLKHISAPKIIFDEILRTMNIEVLLKWHIATRDLMKHKWPATWWDAFKERWFPKWALNRWPIEHKQVTLSELAGIHRMPSDYPTRYYVDTETD